MRGQRRAGLEGVALVVAAGFAAPLAYLLLRTLGDPGDVLSVWLTRDTLDPLLRSLLLATTVSVATALLGTALAWVTARTDLPAGRAWRALLPLPLVIPSFIGAFSLIAAFAPGGLVAQVLGPLGLRQPPQLRGFWGSFLVLTLLTYPYVYLPVVARLRQLPPALEESARLLGHGPVATFRATVLPQARSAILAGTLLVFLYSVSEFGVVQLMRYDTLTRTIYASRIYAPGLAIALSLLLGLIAVGVAAAERAGGRSLRPAETAHGSRPLVVALGRWKAPVVVFVAGTLLFSLIAPMTVLAYWALRGLLRGSTRAGALVADLSDLTAPALNTAFVGVVAAVAAVVVVLPVAYLTVRHRSRAAPLANALVVGGFALPGLVTALALVHWTLRAPVVSALYQTQGLLVFAYVIHFGAQALRAGQVSVAAMPPRVEDAARVLGAGRVRRLLQVELPLMAPGLLAGAGLVLLSTMKELPATLLLAPPGFQTLATKVWTATEDAFLADASLAALLLVVLSGILTWLLVIRHSKALE
ncbi:MAG: iron ABC transporter permease [Acidimicrobiia bacterium]